MCNPLRAKDTFSGQYLESPEEWEACNERWARQRTSPFQVYQLRKVDPAGGPPQELTEEELERACPRGSRLRCGPREELTPGASRAPQR